MSTVIQIGGKELKKSENLVAFNRKLSEEYEGKWVAVLETGEVIADDNLETVYSETGKKVSRIVALFHAPKKGQLLAR